MSVNRIPGSPVYDHASFAAIPILRKMRVQRIRRLNSSLLAVYFDGSIPLFTPDWPRRDGTTSPNQRSCCCLSQHAVGSSRACAPVCLPRDGDHVSGRKHRLDPDLAGNCGNCCGKFRHASQRSAATSFAQADSRLLLRTSWRWMLMRLLQRQTRGAACRQSLLCEAGENDREEGGDRKSVPGQGTQSLCCLLLRRSPAARLYNGFFSQVVLPADVARGSQ